MPTYKPIFQKLPDSIQTVVKKIVEIAEPEAVILFGSRARGENRENSDFDICIKHKHCDEISWTKLLLEIIEEPITLYSVDVVEEEKLMPEYVEEVKNRGLLLYG